ncbi:TetR/AcrR family transcriptional regulator [Nocardia sp. alder85J]|uniref:TetR/AcrR family transcriptional regulator n=1 Tax=Nocardia sp. alder85J TaxID=2862949 RepID=UPI001CD6FF12|nr:TetR/AcrR family transcriptional regulator [Nocardia sp. alder85J]MCX4094591.1 TetR family transcriptional regulator [Nocardia sp. alder85J]
MSGQRPTARPYDTLLAKGEERKLQILAVAQRLLARNGWRSTTLAQIARAAGVTPAGLLHHFESKEQLLQAVLEARDTDDEMHADQEGDIIVSIENVADRFRRSPDLVGMFAVLLTENLEPDAPLHERLLERYRAALASVSEGIQRGQRDGRFRTDIDPAVKAVEVVAFLNGMETSWLLDPSIPLTTVFKEYARSLERELTPASTI